MNGYRNEYKSVGLTKKYKDYRKKKIVHLREKCIGYPLEWSKIAERFGITSGAVIYIYEKAKEEEKKRVKGD